MADGVGVAGTCCWGPDTAEDDALEDLELFFFSSLDGADAAREADEPDLGKALPDAPLEPPPVPPPAFRGLDLPLSLAEVVQVWSPTQFYSVDFSQSRIGVKKCVFNKRTIKVCVSCC